jgi:hypothetical protein
MFNVCKNNNTNSFTTLIFAIMIMANTKYSSGLYSIAFFAMLLVIFTCSCKQKAAEPSYLKIDNFIMSTNQLTEGTNSQNITEAIVFVDDQNMGVYHLPATVPLILTGQHKVKVAPEVVENGIFSSQRHAYTFLRGFDTTIDFKGMQTVAFQPKTSYWNTMKFTMIEDFENPVSLLEPSSFNNSVVLVHDSLAMDNMEAGHCALFEINNGQTMEFASRSEYELPSSTSSESFIEINYKTEVELAVGLYIDEPSAIIKTGVVTLNKKDTWSKAYINLTALVSDRPSGTKFKIFINSINTENVVKRVFVDNIKILHFE